MNRKNLVKILEYTINYYPTLQNREITLRKGTEYKVLHHYDYSIRNYKHSINFNLEYDKSFLIYFRDYINRKLTDYDDLLLTDDLLHIVILLHEIGHIFNIDYHRSNANSIEIMNYNNAIRELLKHRNYWQLTDDEKLQFRDLYRERKGENFADLFALKFVSEHYNDILNIMYKEYK